MPWLCSSAASDTPPYAAGPRPHRRLSPLIADDLLGLEWLWRLAQEPRRLAHRYLVKGPRFVGVFLRSLRARGRTAVPGVLPAAGAVSDDR